MSLETALLRARHRYLCRQFEFAVRHYYRTKNPAYEAVGLRLLAQCEAAVEAIARSQAHA